MSVIFHSKRNISHMTAKGRHHRATYHFDPTSSTRFERSRLVSWRSRTGVLCTYTVDSLHRLRCLAVVMVPSPYPASPHIRGPRRPQTGRRHTPEPIK